MFGGKELPDAVGKRFFPPNNGIPTIGGDVTKGVVLVEGD
jgi:hypothetical protein